MNIIRISGKALVSIILIVVAGFMLLSKSMSIENLKRIHIGKEKMLGEKEVNMNLYNYNDTAAIIKLIFTDYQYLWVLPEISSFFADGRIQDLKPSDPVLTSGKIGYLLWTPPSAGEMKQMPSFIGERIRSGDYKEIFSCKGYRFIKIN